ncbi:MAG TPA: hypothetical protein VIG51_12495 [Candidatus Baltobacteraceae bacterium]|jgi:hypothetical protein
MHWIEDLLRISPDAGSGATELLYGACCALVAGAILLCSRSARRSGKRIDDR